ncbi:hypothetical protein V1519DRAFT_454989 [Lipomyces tetrasporus]
MADSECKAYPTAGLTTCLSTGPNLSEHVDLIIASLMTVVRVAQDAYYIALVLDPRFKALLLAKELGASTAGTIVNGLKDIGLFTFYR